MPSAPRTERLPPHPSAKKIFDRFHVQRLAHDALDEVRRELVREKDDAVERKALKGTRWALQARSTTSGMLARMTDGNRLI